MFWKVHWNYYIPVNDVEDWEGQVDDEEYIEQSDNYYSAFGRFINCTSNGDIGRCWVTAHKNNADIEGFVMLAYSERWEDKITINFN